MNKLREYPRLSREDLEKKDPVKYFSGKTGLPVVYLQEMYRLCELDLRFATSLSDKKFVEYKNISDYIRKIWRITISPRRIRYMHNVMRNHKILLEKLKRGGYMYGSYRTLVGRKA